MTTVKRRDKRNKRSDRLEAAALRRRFTRARREAHRRHLPVAQTYGPDARVIRHCLAEDLASDVTNGIDTVTYEVVWHGNPCAGTHGLTPTGCGAFVLRSFGGTFTVGAKGKRGRGKSAEARTRSYRERLEKDGSDG